MAQRRASTPAELRKRRLRAAELRAQRLKEEKARSRRIDKALKKAAQRDEEIRRIRSENRRLKKRIAELEKQVKENEYEHQFHEVLIGKRKIEDFLSPEELKEAKQFVSELHLRESTQEERLQMMRARWREVETMHGGVLSRGIQLYQWVQRNGFIPSEFWAEYRRRR